VLALLLWPACWAPAAEPQVPELSVRRALADQLIRAGRPREAITECEQILKREPGDPTALKLLSVAAEAAGDLPRAIATLEHLLARGTGVGLADRVRLLRLYAGVGRTADARRGLARIVPGPGLSATDLLDLVNLHVELGSIEEARRLLSGADPAVKGSARGRELAALVAARAGRYGEAVQLVSGLVRELPERKDLVWFLVDLLAAAGEKRAALARARELLDRDASPDPLRLVFAAELALALSDPHGAMALLSRVPAARRTPEWEMLRGRALESCGLLAGAIASLAIAADRFPGRRDLARAVAASRVAAGFVEDALPALRELSGQERAPVADLELAARALRLAGDEARARELLRRVAVAAIGEPDEALERARFLVAEGEAPAAARLLDHALSPGREARHDRASGRTAGSTAAGRTGHSARKRADTARARLVAVWIRFLDGEAASALRPGLIDLVDGASQAGVDEVLDACDLLLALGDPGPVLAAASTVRAEGRAAGYRAALLGARAALRRGDPAAEVTSWLERARAHAPIDLPPPVELALMHAEAGDPDRAIRLLEGPGGVPRADPAAVALARAAVLDRWLGRHREADGIVGELAASAPARPQTRLDLAEHLLDRGHPAHAARLASVAVAPSLSLRRDLLLTRAALASGDRRSALPALAALQHRARSWSGRPTRIAGGAPPGRPRRRASLQTWCDPAPERSRPRSVCARASTSGSCPTASVSPGTRGGIRSWTPRCSRSASSRATAPVTRRPGSSWPVWRPTRGGSTPQPWRWSVRLRTPWTASRSTSGWPTGTAGECSPNGRHARSCAPA
jgi:tetratricopeptide (TPR) repeat protein